MNKKYSIFLDKNEIGFSYFEKADPPMGVVIGKIHFNEEDYNYEFLKNYCLKNNIKLNLDDSEYKVIETQIIPELKIYNDNNVEIISEGGSYISGMNNDGFEIIILGIPYPFYEKEFSNHVKEYHK